MADETLNLSVILKADGSGLKGEVRATKAELDKLRGGTQKADRELSKFEKTSKKAKAALGGLKSQAMSLKAAFTGGSIALFTASLFKAGTAAQGLKTGMLAATGSAEAASRELGFVRSEAERLGVDFNSSAKAFTKLSAAAQGTALAGQGARDIFTAVSEASRVMSLTAEESEGALLAISQMMSKGTVSAEELRGQLGERLPGAFKAAADAMGVSESKLGDMLQKGEILAEDLLPKLAVTLRGRFAAGVKEASNSAAANFARMKNAWEEVKVAIAEGGVLEALNTAFKYIASGLRKVKLLGVELAIAWGRTMLYVENRSESATAFFEAAWKGAVNIAKDLWSGFLSLLAKGLDIVGADKIAAKLQAVADSYKPVTSAAEEYNAKIKKLNADYNAKLQIHQEVADGMRAEAAAALKAAEVLPPLNNGIKNNTELTKEQVAAQKAAAKALEKSRESLQGMLQDLEQQSATFGKTEPAVLRYRLTVGDLAEDVKRLGDEGQRTKEKLIQMADELAAKEMFGETLTEMDKLTAKMQEADRLFEAGAFGKGAEGFDNYSRVIFGIESEMEGLGEKTKETTDKMSEFSIQAARNIQSAFADFLFDPFNGDLKSLASNFAETLRRMAAEALSQEILKGLFSSMAGGAAAGSGGWSGFMATLAAGVAHTGAIIGAPTPMRQVPAFAFAGAPRFHDGGFPGLKMGEVPIIAQKGEEVLAKDDPRNAANGGGPGQAAPTPVELKVINVTDSSMVSEYLNSPAGERIILNTITRNKNALQGA